MQNVVQYGVLAARSAARQGVVPGRAAPGPDAQLPLFQPSEARPLDPVPPPEARHRWAWLLKRVFAVDVTICPIEGCQGRMRLLQIATRTADIARVLRDPALGPRAPPRARRPCRPARSQLSLAFG